MPRLTIRLFQRRYAAWWTFVAGLMVTAGLTWTLHHEAVELDQQRMVQRAAEMQNLLDARLERSEMLLHNLRDYLSLSREGRSAVFEQWCTEQRLEAWTPATGEPRTAAGRGVRGFGGR